MTQVLGYCRSQFDIRGFFTNKYTHHDQNAVSRIRNTLIKAIQDNVYLPKWIITVVDDDIMRYLNLESRGTIDSYKRIIDNIMKEQNKAIAIQNDYLPAKSKMKNQPQLLWIQAPHHGNFHNNDLREKWNAALTAIAPFHNNVHIMPFKKIWDPEDLTLYDKHARRYTSAGYKNYWAAVDKTI